MFMILINHITCCNILSALHYIMLMRYQGNYCVFPAGHTTGGVLKTPDKADKESIQAEWFPCDEKSLPILRAPDILGLIEIASKWYSEGHSVNRRLIAHTSHVSSTIRLIAIHRNGK